MASEKIQIHIKKPECDSSSFELEPSASNAELRKTCGLIGCGIFFKGVKCNSSVSLQDLGVQSGDTIRAFPPSARTGSAKYQAERRLNKGLTKRSIAHKELHQTT